MLAVDCCFDYMYNVAKGGKAMSFKKRLRGLRLEKDLTQAELSKVFGLGASGSTVASWEQGRSRPDIEEVVKLANFFDVSVDYLLCVTDDKRPYERYYFSIQELKNAGILIGEGIENHDVIKFRQLMTQEDITPEFLEEILPIIREIKKRLPANGSK